MLERKSSEKSGYLDKIAEFRVKVKQAEDEITELENQRILAVVAMSDIDIRQLKNLLGGIKNNPSAVTAPPVIQADTNKIERKTDDDENE